MSTSSDVESKMSLKLLVEKSYNKVVFAEAGKEFVDFLFSLFTLPVGAVVKVLNKNSMVGCLGKLYESVEKLSSDYIQPNKDKNLFLSPATSSLSNDQTYPLLLENDAAKPPNKYYVCSHSYQHEYVTDVAGTPCPSCKNKMYTERKYVAPVAAARSSSKGSGGFVRGVFSYTVTDDLVVTPTSAMSSIALLKKFNIEDVFALQEKVVEVGVKEALALLNASLHSKTVLTDVFLSKKVP